MDIATLARHVVDLGLVLAALPEVEVGRRTRGPKALLARLRRKGKRAPKRDPAARARLQRVIGWVDSRFPSPPNCYRRALLEIALDRGAATEPFHMGFRAAGGSRSGHAWVGAGEGTADTYDAIVTL